MKTFLGGLSAIVAVSLAAPAIAEDAQGQWSGVIAGQLTVVLDVSKTADGQWQATFGSPSQSFTSKVDQLTTDATHISFALPKLNASYQASWNEPAKAWTGVWTQGQKVPLNFKRVTPGAGAEPEPVPNRPQEKAIAAAPAPYASEDVKFADAAAGVQLAGSLFLPKGAGPWPAVVLVHGSGPNTRDEDIFGHKIFLVLADHLARQGIAVLRYDKRGIGGSTGDYKSATTREFADDAQAAVNFLRTHAGIDSRHIGIIGHSEGGLIAPMVAARDPKLGFVVLMAGPGVRGELLMVEQMAFHAPAGKAAQQRAINQSALAAIVAEPDPAQARIKAQAIFEQGEREGVDQAGVAAPKAQALTTPWFRTFLTLEPAPALQALRQPILVLNGELDQQVPAKLDLDAIRAALANNPRATVKELPKLNHLFQTATTGSAAEYAVIEETLAPSALAEITGWIRTQTKRD